MDRPCSIGLRALPQASFKTSVRSLNEWVPDTASSWRLVIRVAPETQRGARADLRVAREILRRTGSLICTSTEPPAGCPSLSRMGSEVGCLAVVFGGNFYAPARALKGITGRAQVCTWTPSAYRRPHLHNHQTRSTGACYPRHFHRWLAVVFGVGG